MGSSYSCALEPFYHLMDTSGLRDLIPYHWTSSEFFHLGTLHSMSVGFCSIPVVGIPVWNVLLLCGPGHVTITGLTGGWRFVRTAPLTGTEPLPTCILCVMLCVCECYSRYTYPCLCPCLCLPPLYPLAPLDTAADRKSVV